MAPALQALALALLVAPAGAVPQWIWTKKQAGNGEKATFRLEFEVTGEIKTAPLVVSCDNTQKTFINGQAVMQGDEWNTPGKADVVKFLKPGKNEIRIEASNEGSTAGLLAQLTLQAGPKNKTVIESGPEWTWAAPGSQTFAPVFVIGKHGIAPWGEVLGNARKGGGSTTVPGTEDIKVLPDFKVDLLYTVPKAEQGSWVSLTLDNKGRLVAGDQYGGLYRSVLPATSTTEGIKVEKLNTKVGGAHGLLYAFNSLYVIDNEQGEHGLYRLRDTDGDDQYDEETFLRKIEGGGEHGPHGIVLSPDGKSLLIACGNHTKLVEPLDNSRAARAWGDDFLVPRYWDPRGHAVGIVAPGGYTVATDPDGKKWDLFAYGFRNHYDIAFNAQGELFTYDSDMEWDMGLPWYRPTRIYHVTSGSEFGWRSGSGNQPTGIPDALPPLADIGPGSPTGVTFGTGAKFPAKYQRAFFANDWTYATMYAIHPTPEGAGYRATQEEFLSAKALSLTDVVINPNDGAMYFAIGGRKNQSALYRVTYTGKESTAPAAPEPIQDGMTLRRALETFHTGTPNPATVAEKCWPSLASPDRYLRWAARTAIERVPADSWISRLGSETNPWATIEGALALARTGGKPEFQPAVLAALDRLDFAKASLDQQLAIVRVYGLAFIRLGKPDAATAARLAGKFDAFYPAARNDLNHQLCELLCYLDSPRVVAKTVQLMGIARDDQTAIATDALLARNAGYGKAADEVAASRPVKQSIWYAYCLRIAKSGWTPELRKTYFSWFQTTSTWKGGLSLGGFIEHIRKDALAAMPEAERPALDELSKKQAVVAANFKPAKGPGQNYTVDSVVALTGGKLHGRNFENGRDMFASGLCLTCHRFGVDGGGVGPDLTGAGSRYSIRDLVENIVDPSKVISDQYETRMVEKKDGGVLVGRIVGEENGILTISANPLVPTDLTQVKKDDVATNKVYPISMMPPGLLNSMNPDEVLDLLAYLQSGGKPDDAAFKK